MFFHCGRNSWERQSMNGWLLEYTVSSRPGIPLMIEALQEGHARVESFFGRSFPRVYTVRIFPDRNSLTNFWRKSWNLPDFDPECWMVGSAGSDTLSLLDIQAWEVEACEHNAKDTTRIFSLVAHEQAHIFHGQVSPNPSFDHMEDVGWFVEGIATLVSGQLTGERKKGVREWFLQGNAPERLEEVWSGPHRYGLAGSLAACLEQEYGREMLYRMLSETTESGLLACLGLEERELLVRWRRYVLTGKIEL